MQRETVVKRSRLSQVAPTESLAYWLGLVCRGGRTAQGLRLGDVGKGRIDNGTLSRFESESKWNRNPEAIVACYAEAFGLEDSRKLWDLALNEWIQEGVAPQAPALPTEKSTAKTVDQLSQEIHSLVRQYSKDLSEPARAPVEAAKKNQAAQ